MKDENDFYRVLAMLVLIIAIMLWCFMVAITTRSEKENTVNEPSVPYDYHIFYDDDGKMIIAPDAYHFESDSEGNLILTK